MRSRPLVSLTAVLIAARWVCHTAAGADGGPSAAPATAWRSGIHHLTVDGRGRALVRYVPAYCKPHADAGAIGLDLPRLNDGKSALTSDDPANSTWFDTKGNSRVLLDLGASVELARINVFSWHSGALSPQRYRLWAADGDMAPDADPAYLSPGWKKLAEVDTTPLGEGGKHGSSINARNGSIGRHRYLLFDLPANKPDGPDIVGYGDGLLGGSDPAMAGRWAVVAGSDRSPTGHGITGTHGYLEYRVTLPARGEATLKFLVVGEHQGGLGTARTRFRSIANRTAELLAAKHALYRERILGGVKFGCSDPALNDAFLCAKTNVVMSVMDLRPGYPAPFLAAGFPIYTWLFGCDSLHSTAGVAAAGFDAVARGTLDCLLHFAAEHRQGAHEVASNGRLLGWDHIQETPQLVAACWSHFQWTGDRNFLRAAFPVCRDIIAHALARADQDHDGYLEGPGLMEQPGMGPERIDSVCQLYAAFRSLAGMAKALGEPGADDDLRRAEELKTRFNWDWWNAKADMWACSLRQDGTQTMDDFWAVVFPQQVGIADPDKAAIVLDRIQKEWVNDQRGFVHQWKPKITGEGVGVVHNNVLAQTAFTYGRPDLGWRLMQLSAKAPLGVRMLGAFDETLPGGGDLLQLWSFGPFLGCVIEGLAGIRIQPGADRADLFPQLPGTLDWFKLEDCRIGRHRLTLEQRRTGGTITTIVTHSQGDAPLSGTFWFPAHSDGNVRIDGKTGKTVPLKTHPSGMPWPGVVYELRPGQSHAIETPAG